MTETLVAVCVGIHLYRGIVYTTTIIVIMYRKCSVYNMRMTCIIVGTSGGVRARKGSTEWQAKGLAAGKSVLPCTPSARGRIIHPAERKRGARWTRGDVPPSLTQWRRSGGGLGGVARRRSAAYTPVVRRTTLGPAAEPSSAGRRRRVGQSIARNTSG